MGFNSGFKGLKTQSVPRCKHYLGYKNQSVYAVSGTSRCLFSDKYKTHKYSVGRARQNFTLQVHTYIAYLFRTSM